MHVPTIKGNSTGKQSIVYSEGMKWKTVPDNIKKSIDLFLDL